MIKFSKIEEVKLAYEQAIKDNINLIDRANKRLIAWEEANDPLMVNQWREIKEGVEADLKEIQKEYDLMFGKEIKSDEDVIIEAITKKVFDNDLVISLLKK